MKRIFDLQRLFSERAPKLTRKFPPGSFPLLRAILHERRINRAISQLSGRDAAEFSEGVLRRLGIRMEIEGLEYLQQSPRLVVAANHPTGGVEGFALIATLLKATGSLKLPANEVLAEVPALRPHVVGLDRYRGNAGVGESFAAAFEGDETVLVFPSGRTARMRGNRLHEYPWLKSFVTHARRSKRQICPVWVSGRNTRRFYALHKVRRLLGVKLNIEMFLLPDELFHRRGECLRIHVGPPRNPTSHNLQTDAEYAETLRQEVEALAGTDSSHATPTKIGISRP
ncbi:MAG: hypothetical protein EA428_14720 [Spirochaetaceae bacterium]|nr:MAG: hypothetical protein EA428_14720 [Spirochaetaceae bacterium]